MENIIYTKNLSKEFKLFHNNKERLLNIIPFINKQFSMHRSLDNINFEVKKGEFVSIIGKNGSGKSTLLKILCGVLKPTNGSFSISGKVVSLLELGTGFNQDLSGRDNIFNSARIMNLDLIAVRNKIEEIEQFADLEEYFDMPVKTYSSGMYVRLAMSLFLHLEPSVFIIDEALSVGDIFFQQKCFKKIDEMRGKGVTFLFVSHDINLIQNMSDRVLLLSNGKQIFFGDKHEACKLYFDGDKKLITDTDSKENKSGCKSANNVLETKNQIKHRDGAKINSLQIIDEYARHTMQVEMTKNLKFIVHYNVVDSLKKPTLAISFFNSKSFLITTVICDLFHDKDIVEIVIPFMIEAGEYSFDINIGSLTTANSGVFITEYKGLGPICVLFNYQNRAPFLGLVGLNTNVLYYNLEEG